MGTCTRPAQDQSSQHPSMYGREAHETLHFAEKLLAVDGDWGRENRLLHGCGSWEAAYAPVDGPASVLI